MPSTQPPLRPLHPRALLVRTKLRFFRSLDTDELVASLSPGEVGALKTRVDGTILDGHHRVAVLRERDFDVDALPREVILRERSEEP